MNLRETWGVLLSRSVSPGIPVLLVVSLLLAMAAGCALPIVGTDQEILFGYTCRNQDGTSHRRVVAGFDLRIGSGWDGGTLGWSDLTLIDVSIEDPVRESGSGDGAWIPTPPAATVSPGAVARPAHGLRYRFPLALAWRNENGDEHVLGLALHERHGPTTAAAYVQHSLMGLNVDATPHLVGVALSARRAGMLIIPEDSDDLYILDFSSRDKLASSLRRVSTKEMGE